MPSTRPTRDRATIHDVAAHAGVSKSLVSLVLRDQPHVSTARRTAVWRAVDELGYRPNAVARSLASRHSRVVGVLVLDLHNPVFVEILDGLSGGPANPDVTMLLVSAGGDPAREHELLLSLLDLQADGVALVGHRLPPATIDKVADERPLVVVTRRDIRRPGVDTVCNDDAAGARLAVDHLVGLGHRRIWHLSGGGSAVARDRRRGYEAAMAAHGLADVAHVVDAGFTDEAGFEAAAALISGRQPPTAVFVANDFSALGAMAGLEQAGMRVPGDISVVGYDGMALGAMRRIDLTTVAQPLPQMGRIAAELLSSRIQQPGRRARNVVLQPQLAARSSSAGPPGSATLVGPPGSADAPGPDGRG
ncbi:LacI family DNA-binding transcriptional regulator [soil metagenome]